MGGFFLPSIFGQTFARRAHGVRCATLCMALLQIPKPMEWVYGYRCPRALYFGRGGGGGGPIQHTLCLLVVVALLVHQDWATGRARHGRVGQVRGGMPRAACNTTDPGDCVTTRSHVFTHVSARYPPPPPHPNDRQPPPWGYAGPLCRLEVHRLS